jgi:hypothetical protein
MSTHKPQNAALDGLATKTGGSTGYPTDEQKAALAAYDPAFESRVFSGDVYLRRGPGAPVLRIDPDGREHYPAQWPTRGVTLQQAEASAAAIRATITTIEQESPQALDARIERLEHLTATARDGEGDDKKRWENELAAARAEWANRFPGVADCERVAAGDIQVGDRAARARTHPFVKVAQINVGNSAVRLLNEHGATIARPLKTASWWRIAERGC